MDANNIDEVIVSIVTAISQVGYWRVILIAILLYLGFISYKLIKRWMTRADREEQNAREEKKIALQKESIRLNYDLVGVVTEFITVLTTVVEKLETSASIFNHSKLTRRFLGLDRDFADIVKAKLLGYVENNSNDSFYNIKEELKDVFHDRVLTELAHFTFNELTLSPQVLSVCKTYLEDFLVEFEAVQLLGGIEACREFIHEQNKVQELLITLAEIIESEYKSKISTDQKLTYLKKES